MSDFWVQLFWSLLAGLVVGGCSWYAGYIEGLAAFRKHVRRIAKEHEKEGRP